MWQELFFFTQQPLPQDRLEDFLAEAFKGKTFLWVPDFFEYNMENDIFPSVAYISLKDFKMGFRYCYSIHFEDEHKPSVRQNIGLMVLLARKEHTEILISDDEANPRSYILIEPDGQASSVEIKDNGIMVIDNFYNFPLGEFTVTSRLLPEELQALSALIKTRYPLFVIDSPGRDRKSNDSFYNARKYNDRLRPFDFRYELLTVGKDPWMDRDEKTEQLIGIMIEFNRITKREICLFPPNFSVIQNIPGGSDSEDHCLIINGRGIEKIIYKHRRDSW